MIVVKKLLRLYIKDKSDDIYNDILYYINNTDINYIYKEINNNSIVTLVIKYKLVDIFDILIITKKIN